MVPTRIDPRHGLNPLSTGNLYLPSMLGLTEITDFTEKRITPATKSSSSQLSIPGTTIPSFVASNATTSWALTARSAVSTTTTTALTETQQPPVTGNLLPTPSIDVDSLSTADKKELMALTTKQFECRGKKYYGVDQDDITLLFHPGEKYVRLKDIKHRISVLKFLLDHFGMRSPIGDDWCSDLPRWKPENRTPYAYFHRNNARIIVAMQGFYTTSEATRLLVFSQVTNGRSRTSSLYIEIIEDTWDPNLPLLHNLWRRYGGFYHLMKHGEQWGDWYKDIESTTRKPNFLVALSLTENSLLTGAPPSETATENARQVSALPVGDEESLEHNPTTSRAELGSAPLSSHGVSRKNLTVVDTIHLTKSQVLQRLTILRRSMEKGRKREEVFMEYKNSFLADAQWESKLAPFGEHTKVIYARLLQTADRLIFVTSGLLEIVVEELEQFRKIGGTPMAEVQAIENHSEEAGMIQTFWWQFERFYELIWRTHDNKALLDMLNDFKILNRYPAHKRYLAHILVPHLALDGDTMLEDDRVQEYITLVRQNQGNLVHDIVSPPDDEFFTRLKHTGEPVSREKRIPSPEADDDESLPETRSTKRSRR